MIRAEFNEQPWSEPSEQPLGEPSEQLWGERKEQPWGEPSEQLSALKEGSVDFGVLLLGTDINTYYMARNFHEAYGIKPHAIGKVSMGFTQYSSIMTCEIVPDLWNAAVMKSVAERYALAHPNKPLILVGTNDTYVRLIVENAEFLRRYFLFNYVDLKTLNNLLIKQNFYREYKDLGLAMPKSYFVDCARELDEEELKQGVSELLFPVILKPGDGIKYHDHEFAGQAKVYKLNSAEEIIKVVKEITEAGYDDELVIQEFIPGDDSRLFDAIFYCNAKAEPQLMSFAQIGLQERTPGGIGNCTVLVNGYNEFGNTAEIKDKLVELLKKIEYKGIAEFDLKYDERDATFKVFEINPRQARSSYYLTACGYNLAEYLVDDLLYQKPKDFVFIDKKMVLSFVPFSVVKNYVTNEKLKSEILRLKREGSYVRPLHYKNDLNLMRRPWLVARDLNYLKKYREYSW
ncbi:MAG: hypothetical protein LBB42_05350 [Coriobacteriales bacterium]|jgi:D-aspartate ligase|nr:hypothetical protein [Coriobacteriales bacterium]